MMKTVAHLQYNPSSICHCVFHLSKGNGENAGNNPPELGVVRFSLESKIHQKNIFG